jgi:heat shock protein HslJ
MNFKSLSFGLVILLFLITGCASNGKANLAGTITHVEQGKDGVQVELQTDDLPYSITISRIKAEIIGSFDQLVVGAEIEVTGEEISGMDPPLIVADSVRIIKSPHPLTGSAWILTSFNDREPVSDYQPTLQFEADQVSGTTGCNNYGGTYQINGDTIKLEGVFSTEMACLNPEGLMDQEQLFLETLRDVVKFSLADGELILSADGERYLRFSSYEPISASSSAENPDDTASVESPTEVSEDQDSAIILPPWDHYLYQDAKTGIGIYIPKSWLVTGIVEGDYAILQSYPEDKYIGGEPLEEGDTKCDLFIQPLGMSSDEVVDQMKSFPMTTILSEELFTLNSGQVANRLEIDSMGKSISVVAELGERVVVLTCFGDFFQVDEIAVTIFASE